MSGSVKLEQSAWGGMVPRNLGSPDRSSRRVSRQHGRDPGLHSADPAADICKGYVPTGEWFSVLLRTWWVLVFRCDISSRRFAPSDVAHRATPSSSTPPSHRAFVRLDPSSLHVAVRTRSDLCGILCLRPCFVRRVSRSSAWNASRLVKRSLGWLTLQGFVGSAHIPLHSSNNRNEVGGIPIRSRECGSGLADLAPGSVPCGAEVHSQRGRQRGALCKHR